VPAHMDDAYLVPCQQRIDGSPEIVVLQRLELVAFPAAVAVGTPAGKPFVDPLGQILAVGDQLDPAWPFEDFQASQGTFDLHPVVGRVGIRTEAFDYLSRCGVLKDEGPSARPRIAAASTIRVKLDVIFRGRESGHAREPVGRKAESSRAEFPAPEHRRP